MSSIMRARSGLTGGWEGSEVIGVPFSSRRLMDLRCSGSDAPTVTRYRASPSSKLRRPRRVLPPARAGSFSGAFRSIERGHAEPVDSRREVGSSTRDGQARHVQIVVAGGVAFRAILIVVR